MCQLISLFPCSQKPEHKDGGCYVMTPSPTLLPETSKIYSEIWHTNAAFWGRAKKVLI